MLFSEILLLTTINVFPRCSDKMSR